MKHTPDLSPPTDAACVRLPPHRRETETARTLAEHRRRCCAGITAALAFAKGNFVPFQEDFFSEIKRLMGCMLYAGRPLDDTPYRDLASANLLVEAASDFVKAACGTLGQVCPPPAATLPPHTATQASPQTTVEPVPSSGTC